MFDNIDSISDLLFNLGLDSKFAGITGECSGEYFVCGFVFYSDGIYPIYVYDLYEDSGCKYVYLYGGNLVPVDQDNISGGVIAIEGNSIPSCRLGCTNNFELFTVGMDSRSNRPFLTNNGFLVYDPRFIKYGFPVGGLGDFDHKPGVSKLIIEGIEPKEIQIRLLQYLLRNLLDNKINPVVISSEGWDYEDLGLPDTEEGRAVESGCDMFTAERGKRVLFPESTRRSPEEHYVILDEFQARLARTFIG